MMFCVAALQTGFQSDGTAGTVKEILKFEDEIKAANCKLLVLPETLLGGYPKGQDFGVKIGFRTPQGKEMFQKYWSRSVSINGPEIHAICNLAKSNPFVIVSLLLLKPFAGCGTNIVIGVVERDGSTLYCTVVFISEKGDILGKHRKLVPTAGERFIFGTYSYLMQRFRVKLELLQVEATAHH